MAYKSYLVHQDIVWSNNKYGNRAHLGKGPGGGRFTYNPFGRGRYEYTDPNTGEKRYTERGQRRYEREWNANYSKAKNKRAEDETLGDVNRWIDEDIDSGISAAKSINNASGAVSTLAGQLMKDPPRGDRYDLSNMSDAELRAILNREQMERQYNDYFNPQQTNNGREWVQGAAATVGAVATVGLTALEIAKAVKALRG